MIRRIRAVSAMLLLVLVLALVIAAALLSGPSAAGRESEQLLVSGLTEASSMAPADLVALLCPPRSYQVSLPQVLRQESGLRLQQQPTLGPSPTSTRTPAATLGPTSTPSPTASATSTATPTPGGPTNPPGPTVPPTFEVLKVVYPEKGNIGTAFIFTIGVVNPLDVPVQVSLEDTLPEGLQLRRVWAPPGATLQLVGDTFTLALTVAPDWTDNIFFCAVAEVPPCSYSCEVQNNAAWSATWAGGSGSGVASSQKILLLNVTPTPTPVTPTWTPIIFPTWPPSPTPGTTTPGPSPSPTATSPLPTVPTVTPTGPLPTVTKTPQPTLGPSPTPTPP